MTPVDIIIMRRFCAQHRGAARRALELVQT
jgi:hypothetical protein